MHSLRSRLSYANVVSTIALLIAIGGGSAFAAEKLKGTKIAKRSLPGNRLKKNTEQSKEVKNLLAKDFKAGQLPAGAQGRQGRPGVNGATKVVIRQAAPVTVGNGFDEQSIVECAPSEKAVGGGASWVEVANHDMRLTE